MTMRFPFRFDSRFRPFLAGLGVTPAKAWVEVSDEWFVARFGPWAVRTPRVNIAEVRITGPYRWYRAIGVRMSSTDRGLTFGSSTVGGVCVLFRDPVPGIEPTGTVRHQGLTVTVADADGLANALA